MNIYEKIGYNSEMSLMEKDAAQAAGYRENPRAYRSPGISAEDRLSQLDQYRNEAISNPHFSKAVRDQQLDIARAQTRDEYKYILKNYPKSYNIHKKEDLLPAVYSAPRGNQSRIKLPDVLEMDYNPRSSNTLPELSSARRQRPLQLGWSPTEDAARLMPVDSTQTRNSRFSHLYDSAIDADYHVAGDTLDAGSARILDDFDARAVRSSVPEGIDAASNATPQARRTLTSRGSDILSRGRRFVGRHPYSTAIGAGLGAASAVGATYLYNRNRDKWKSEQE